MLDTQMHEFLNAYYLTGSMNCMQWTGHVGIIIHKTSHHYSKFNHAQKSSLCRVVISAET